MLAADELGKPAQTALEVAARDGEIGINQVIDNFAVRIVGPDADVGSLADDDDVIGFSGVGEFEGDAALMRVTCKTSPVSRQIE